MLLGTLSYLAWVADALLRGVQRAKGHWGVAHGIDEYGRCPWRSPEPLEAFGPVQSRVS